MKSAKNYIILLFLMLHFCTFGTEKFDFVRLKIDSSIARKGWALNRIQLFKNFMLLNLWNS